MGRALKFRIFFWSKLNLGERSKAGPGRPFAESAKELLTNLKPQLVSACAVELPTIVYTDAAFENDLATWGSVLVDRVSKYRMVHWGRVACNTLAICSGNAIFLKQSLWLHCW